MSYIEFSEYREVHIDVSIDEVFRQLSDEDLLNELNKRNLSNRVIVGGGTNNGHIRELAETLNEILYANINHVTVNKELREKYLC